ncbi:tryptophan synthase beta subunit-like PLP-dependent enzyme [Roridomyces roridus]|uniref:Tryptophan synthase beta subunit-like PLP-dependent enzyme n=1 Tax=Roridomyces roridus TaxID=1738132 RepID=A0AAD7FHH7_9AGAR|nr:tryptophan synthase beta subunit-like PLP-dependent enzyme [Roridomyces roridus]
MDRAWSTRRAPRRPACRPSFADANILLSRRRHHFTDADYDFPDAEAVLTTSGSLSWPECFAGGCGHKYPSLTLTAAHDARHPPSHIPRENLLFGPSPIHALDRMSADLSGKVKIWAKREDCNSGLTFGGNETRKLEYLLADALAQKCDTLVSIGGVQSNHTRQVAAVAAKYGLKVAQQEAEMGVFFDTVVVCSVTGSTQAGMIAGFKLLEKTSGGKARRVIGIDASAKPDETRAQVLRIAQFTAVKIGLKEEDIGEEDVILDERYHAGCYGIPDKRTVEAIKYGAAMEAFITDPLYEGKSLAGMVDMIRQGEIQDGNVLYAHLGGQLALNVYSGMEATVGLE